MERDKCVNVLLYHKGLWRDLSALLLMSCWHELSCFIALVALLKLYTCVRARGHRWVVSVRAINIGTSEHFFKKNFWDDDEDDAQKCSRHWNGIVLEDIFHIETWITAPDNFLQLLVARTIRTLVKWQNCLLMPFC